MTTTNNRPVISVKARPDPGPSDPSRAITVALAVLGVFVTYVPITGVSVALTRIGAATHANTAALQWISDGYVIPMAAAVLSGGLFGDRYGRRRIYLIGMALTVVGAGVAALSGLSADTGALAMIWTGQAISGLGAGLLLPTTLALIAHVVPDPRERGKYIGVWATGLLLGLCVGPIVSGAIIDRVAYGWIFVPVIALAGLAGIAAAAWLPESTAPGERSLDIGGQLFATLAIAGLILGVIEGGARGWTDPVTLTGLIVGALALIGFLLTEARSTSPLIDLGLFGSPAFSAAGFSALLALFSVVGTTFLISVFLGEVQHLDALQIGLRLLFVTGVAVVVNPVIGATMHRIRPAYLLTAGLAVGAVGVFTLTGVDEHTTALDLGWRLATFGLSLAMMLTTVSVTAVNAVPWRKAGMAAATNTALRQFGGALGPAVLGAVFVSRLTSGASPVSALHTSVAVNGFLLVLGALICLVTTHIGRTSD